MRRACSELAPRGPLAGVVCWPKPSVAACVRRRGIGAGVLVTDGMWVCVGVCLRAHVCVRGSVCTKGSVSSGRCAANRMGGPNKPGQLFMAFAVGVAQNPSMREQHKLRSSVLAIESQVFQQTRNAASTAAGGAAVGVVFPVAVTT